MRKFKFKRTLRKERAAWVEYAIEQQAFKNAYAERVEELITEKLALIEERNEIQRDFEYMEKRYRNAAE